MLQQIITLHFLLHVLVGGASARQSVVDVVRGRVQNSFGVPVLVPVRASPVPGGEREWRGALGVQSATSHPGPGSYKKRTQRAG